MIRSGSQPRYSTPSSSSASSSSSTSSSIRSSTRDEKHAQTSPSQARQYFLDACQAHDVPAPEDFETLLALPGLTDGMLELSVARDSTGGFLARHLSGHMLRALNQYVRDVSDEEGIRLVSLPPLTELADVLRSLSELPHLKGVGLTLSTGSHAPGPEARALLQALDRRCDVYCELQRPPGSGESTSGADDAEWPEGYAFLAQEGFEPSPSREVLDAFHKVILASPERFKHLDHCLQYEELEDTFAALDTKAAAGACKATPPWLSHAPLASDLCRDHPGEQLYPEHLGAYWLMQQGTPMRILGEAAQYVSVLTDKCGRFHLAVETKGDNPRLALLNEHIVDRESADKWEHDDTTHLYVLPMARLPASEVHWMHPGQSARDRALNVLKGCVAIEQRNPLPAQMTDDEIVAAAFPALQDDKAGHAVAALLHALDVQAGTFDTSRLDEPTQVLAHVLPARGWQALDEYVHSFNGTGIRAVNLTMQASCPIGVVQLAALQTLFLPAVLNTTLSDLLSHATARFMLVFDAVAEDGTIAVPPGFPVYTLELDPPDATVVITGPDGAAIGHHPLQTHPGASDGEG